VEGAGVKDWPLSTKLTAWSALIAGLSTLSCVIGTGFFLMFAQIGLLDGQLKKEAKHFFDEWERQGNQPVEARVAQIPGLLPVTSTKRYVQLQDDQHRVLYVSPDLPAANLPSTNLIRDTIRLRSEPYRMGTFRRRGLELRIATNMVGIEEDATERAITVASALPVMVVLTAFGGWWIARKALRPVQLIATAAEEITAARLDRRLPVPAIQDEIGRLTKVLNAMIDRLDISFRQAVRFSADASHELKTPLTALRTSIEDLLESPTLSEAERRAVAGLLEQTHRLASVTDSLLLLSRADAGQLQLDLESTNVCEIIRACVDDARILAEPREIQIEENLPSALYAKVDSGRLSRILLNLLENAIKYNLDHGLVKIAAGADTAKIFLWITIGNMGQEIRAEIAPHLFERFFRDDRQAGVPGHGLGLSLARELARAQGGEITLAQSRDGWTEFRISLPLQTDLPRRPEGTSRELAVARYPQLPKAKNPGAPPLFRLASQSWAERLGNVFDKTTRRPTDRRLGAKRKP
jgi:signal transduction histidine kinase